MARDPIIDEMARTLWVLAWADAEEEHGGRAYPGTNLMDVAPETPPEAWDAANQLVGQFCGINECGIHTLLYRAARADAEANKVFEGAVVGESTLFDNERYQRAFGYSLAMEAVGHGVSWFDDHADFDITFPTMPFEFTADEVEAYTPGESLPSL